MVSRDLQMQELIWPVMVWKWGLERKYSVVHIIRIRLPRIPCYLEVVLDPSIELVHKFEMEFSLN